MATIILSLADLGTAMPLQEILERSGHQVRWDAESADGPHDSALSTDPQGAKPQGPSGTDPLGTNPLDANPPGTKSLSADLVILDAEMEASADAAEAWRDHDPPPALLMIGRSDVANALAASAQISIVEHGANATELEEKIQSAIRHRYAGRMSGAYARGLLQLGPSTDPITDATRIIKASRRVGVGLVRECLRWKASHYVCAGSAIPALREQRALTIPEVSVVQQLNGTKTIQTLVAAEENGVLAGRLLWALISAGVVICTPEPHDRNTADRMMIIEIRSHLRARRIRLQRATHYDVLEVELDASPEAVDYSARTLALRYSPDKLRQFDLGDLTSVVDSNWQQILSSRQILMNLIDRANYNDSIVANKKQFDSPWAFEISDSQRAEASFTTGQRALIAGEAFKAVSNFAAACRSHPDNADYEAYLCWARFRAEVDRGGTRDLLIAKERALTEQALSGRRPWPRALVALALLCAAQGDSASARFHLSEALTINPNLPAAKQLLSRL